MTREKEQCKAENNQTQPEYQVKLIFVYFPTYKNPVSQINSLNIDIIIVFKTAHSESYFIPN